MLNKYIALLIYCLVCISHSAVASLFTDINLCSVCGNSDMGNHQEPLDSLKSLMERYNNDRNRIINSFDGYECSSEETWYFDSLNVVCGFHSVWNLEGTSGEEFYWFNQGQLSVVYTERYGQDDKPDVLFLTKQSDIDKLKTYESEIIRKKKGIFNFINNNLDKVQVEIDYTINIEEAHNYGVDVIETTRIFIDSTLFEKLFGK